mgnify:FL=1
MNKKSLWLGLSLLFAPLGTAHAMPFGTFDPRSMAMGGTGVASGTSANAAFFNPALLATASKDEDFSIELPIVSIRVADQDEFIDKLDTFQDGNAIDDFSNAINTFNAATTPAQALAAKDAVVSTGNTLITGLGTLSNRNLEMEIMAGAAVGIPSKKFAASVFVAGRAMGGAVLDITANDLGDIQAILDQLAANNFAPITDPTTTMTSAVLGRGAVISEVGIALAKEFGVLGGIGVGMTPKFQKVDTFDYALNIETADVTLNEGKKSYNSVNFDVGVGKAFQNNWKVGAVIKNLLPKSYTTARGNTLETKPQARVGAAHQTRWSVVSMDLDLLKNDPIAPGFDTPTQYAGIGIELDAFDFFQVRLGYRHNLSDSDTSVATAGLGFSPFGVHIDVGVMGSSNEVALGVQTGFRF